MDDDSDLSDSDLDSDDGDGDDGIGKGKKRNVGEGEGSGGLAMRRYDFEAPNRHLKAQWVRALRGQRADGRHRADSAFFEPFYLEAEEGPSSSSSLFRGKKLATVAKVLVPPAPAAISPTGGYYADQRQASMQQYFATPAGSHVSWKA
jgi:hypothetical protein